MSNPLDLSLEPRLLRIANDWRWRKKRPTPEEARELSCLLWRWAERERQQNERGIDE